MKRVSVVLTDLEDGTATYPFNELVLEAADLETFKRMRQALEAIVLAREGETTVAAIVAVARQALQEPV